MLWRTYRTAPPDTILNATAKPASIRTVSLSFAAALLVIAAVLATLLKTQHRQMMDHWAQRQSSVADDRVRLVANWLHERTLDAQSNAQAPEVIEYLSKLGASENGAGSDNRRMLAHLALLTQAKESHGYEGLYLLNAEGHLAGQALGSQKATREVETAAKRCIDRGRVGFEWLVGGPGDGSLCVIAPVFSGGRRIAPNQSSSRRLGAVAFKINVQTTLFPLLTAETVPTATGETVIVSQTGRHILYVSPLRAIPGGFQVFADDRTHGAHLALAGRTVFGRFVDYRGASVLAAVRPIAGTDLGLVAQIDYAEASADFMRYARFETILASLLVLAGGGWFFGYRRQLSTEIANLREAEFRTIIEATPGGLLILDGANFIALLNSQTERLFGYRREELVGVSVTAILPEQDWIAEWKESRRQSGRALFGRATTARRRDGTTFPCELSLGAVRRTADESVFVVIRDMTERKLIERALEKTEVQYAALFNGISDAAFVFDFADGLVPGKFIQVNDVVCKMLGYTRQELLQRSPCDVQPPDELTTLFPIRNEVMAGDTCVFETVFVARDGKVVPVEVSARIIDLPDTRAVLSVARDITERKRNLALLAASERRYRRFVERNASAFIRNRLNGEVLDCNDSAALMMGYTSQAEFKATAIPEMYADPCARQAILDLLKKDGVINGCEIRLRRKDGTLIWVLANLTLVDDGGESVIEGTVVDITDRKRVETELQTIVSLVQASSDFVGYASPDGEVLFVNEAGQKFLGAEGSAILRTHILDHIAPEDRQRVREVVLPAVLREGRWAGETLFRNMSTGALIPMWQSAFSITEPGSNRTVAMATVCRDLTEWKNKENQLREAQKAAEAGNREKSRFLASMSHEIRTPMNGVLGMVRLMLASDLSVEQQHYANVILSSGTHLLTLINQILDLSKIEAGKVVLEKLDFECLSLLRGATEALAVEARNKGLEFGLSLEPDMPRFLRGDPARLTQVIVNLVGNAVKFTSKGSVKIAASLDGREGQTLMVRFTISDTGIGVFPEYASRLFSPFMQGDGSTTRTYGGTGLGLSVSKQIVQLMGGQIGFESEPGQGSCFWFTAALEQSATREQLIPNTVPPDPFPAKPRALERRRARILGAEDHHVNREVLKSILDHVGYQVDIVENGAEAVKALQAAAYDLVLMDIEMPVMDGFQATKLIRDPHTEAVNPRVPIIAVTASAMAGDRERCIAAGMDDYLAKPIDPESLVRMLEKWLSNNTQGGSLDCMQAGKTPAPKAAPVFDYDALLKRMMGNRPAAKRVAKVFLESAPSQLALLREHLSARDVTSARRAAHTLKGSAATISALALRDVALEAEHAASASSWETIEKLIPELEEQLNRLSEAITNAGAGTEKVGYPSHS